MLLNLGEDRAVTLLVSSQVLEEINRALRRKATAQLPALALLLERSRVNLIPAAPQDVFERCREWYPTLGTPASWRMSGTANQTSW